MAFQKLIEISNMRMLSIVSDTAKICFIRYNVYEAKAKATS